VGLGREGERTLVLRSGPAAPPSPEPPPGATFRLLAGPRDGIALHDALRARYGRGGAVRALAKLATRSRLLYCALDPSGEIVHDGWLRIGAWSERPVGPRDVVIGPVRTRSDARGQGVARYALASAMSAMRRQGHDSFLLATTEDNAAARALFASCGFVEEP
jgi:L-amino acid N-acyltransferase YncA